MLSVYYFPAFGKVRSLWWNMDFTGPIHTHVCREDAWATMANGAKSIQTGIRRTRLVRTVKTYGLASQDPGPGTGH